MSRYGGCCSGPPTKSLAAREILEARPMKY
jgi:hypothetical protein